MKSLILIISIFTTTALFAQTKEEIDSSIYYASELIEENSLEAFEILTSATDNSINTGYKKGEADSYYQLSEYYRITRKESECIDHLYKALKIYKDIEYKKGEADCYNDIAMSYEEFELEGDILDYYYKSLEINKEIVNNKDIIVNYINISTYHMSSGEYEKSFLYLDTAVAIAKNIEDSVQLAHAINLRGYLHMSLGEYEEAIVDYQSALSIYKNKGMDYYQLAPIFNLVSVYFTVDAKQYKSKSIGLLKDAEALSIKSGDKYYTSLVYKFFSKIYANDNDYKNAYENHKLYKVYSDSLNNTESDKKLVELKMQHDFDIEKEQIALIQEKKNLTHAEEAKRSIIVRNSFIVGSLLLLILVIVSFRAFINKKKTGEEIAEKNKEITDSINYAKMLQTAILSPSNTTDDELEDLFVLFQPKDIVSGDFYWVETIGNSVYFSAVDCTGHGVPGAMLSIVGHNALENIIHNHGICQPSMILDKLNDAVYSKLKVQGSREMHDGMDAAFCRLDRERNVLEFAGANNPVYIVRDGEVIIHKGTKASIGQERGVNFMHNEIFLQDGDGVYVFSDGYADQFGGEKDKKLGSKEFKRFLVSIQENDMDTQRQLLSDNINEWMSKSEQIDDICVIGIKV
jgi:serine phosphatase RsbU (regulator of sigma subunit)/tetratricopeptide (TPR) repeat protein